jgi:hypothetical protein
MDVILGLIDTLEKKGVGLQLSVESKKTVEISIKNKNIDINIVEPSKIGKLIKELNINKP